MPTIYQVCDQCKHAILDQYELDNGEITIGCPIGCKFSDDSRHQLIAQKNGVCSDFLPKCMEAK